VNKQYTGKQVIKAGEILLEENINDPEFDAAMDILSYWRFSHEIPLGKALEILRGTTLEIDSDAIFAKRLKRYPSIVNKLKRFRKMKLKNMQDIGGCRAIVSTPKKLQKVVRALRKRPEFKNSKGKIRFKDYITQPKEDGYRSYHLVGQFRDEYNELKDIELQVRTHLQHDWATAVEIVDLFTGQALKSNQGNQDWEKFFSFVSKQFAVMESIHLFNTLPYPRKLHEYINKIHENNDTIESCHETQTITKKLEVVNVFNAFTHSLNIVDGKIEENSLEGYVLVEVDIEKSIVKTTFFKQDDNKEAEKMYIEAEKKSAGQSNLVIALVSTTAVGGIKDAYPNYFADSTEFLRHLLIVTETPVKTHKSIFHNLFFPN